MKLICTGTFEIDLFLYISRDLFLFIIFFGGGGGHVFIYVTENWIFFRVNSIHNPFVDFELINNIPLISRDMQYFEKNDLIQQLWGFFCINDQNSKSKKYAHL